MHETFCQGSVRVDLLGGTLDIYPINVVLDNVNTINCATSLMAKVSVSTDPKETITIISKDYNLEKSFDLNKIKTFSYSDKELGPLKFLMLLLKEFEPTKGASNYFRVQCSSWLWAWRVKLYGVCFF